MVKGLRRGFFAAFALLAAAVASCTFPVHEKESYQPLYRLARDDTTRKAAMVAQLAGFLKGPVTSFMWLPVLVFEVVFAFWLMIKGVKVFRLHVILPVNKLLFSALECLCRNASYNCILIYVLSYH